MSTPLADHSEIKGVLQVSRKGASLNSVGDDFSKNQLEALTIIAAIVARFI